MTRIALLSDIHGNTIALDAVLEDIRRRGVADAYWVLGDLAAIGFDPVGVLERLKQLPAPLFIHGNTDRYLVTGERPLPPQDAILADPKLIPNYLMVVASFAWTLGALTVTGWMPWLAALPAEIRQTLPDGTRFLGVHAAPGTDDGNGISPLVTAGELEKMVKDAGVDLIVSGHTHWPLDKKVQGVEIFNLGSVSNPFPPDLRASYALLEVGMDGHRLERCFVDYDHQAVIEAVRKVKHPAEDYIVSFQLGRNLPRWMAK